MTLLECLISLPPEAIGEGAVVEIERLDGQRFTVTFGAPSAPTPELFTIAG